MRQHIDYSVRAAKKEDTHLRRAQRFFFTFLLCSLR
jgi:hypothetical protein